MARNAQDLKAQLMAEAEEVIDNLLAGASEKEDLMLGDIERLVRTAGQRVMQRFTQDLVEAEAEEAGSNLCSECGQKMRYKGHKGRDLARDRRSETGASLLLLPRVSKGLFSPWIDAGN